LHHFENRIFDPSPNFLRRNLVLKEEEEEKNIEKPLSL